MAPTPIVYTTQIHNLERQLPDGKVIVAHWSIYGTDGTYGIGTTTAGMLFEGELTIPYEDLTEEIVVGWVESQLGPEKLSEIHKMIADNIAEQANPTVGNGLPWEDNSEGGVTKPAPTR